MGVRVTNLRNNERKVTVDLFGIEVNAWYRPMALSWDEENQFHQRWIKESKMLEKILEGADPNQEVDKVDQEERTATFEYMEKLLGRWDLENDKPDPNRPIMNDEGEVIGYHPLLGSDGEVQTFPTPITVAEMKTLSPVITMSIFVEIGKDRSPNSTKEGNSAGPSLTTQAEEGSLTGT